MGSSKLRFSRFDVLFGKIRPYLHKVALAHFSGVCSSDMIVVRVKRAQWLGYLYLTLFSDAFIDIATAASKGTKMPRADWAFLSNLEIKVPDDDLLEIFQRRFGDWFALIEALVSQNRLLEQTRDLLLPRLISGKLRVDDLDIALPPSMRAEPV